MKIPRETEPDKFKENNRYFKLCFIAKFFTFTKNELQKLTPVLPFVFSTFKYASLFLTEDNASYVGESYRHISASTHERLETDKSSNIYRHLKNLQCKFICDEDFFSVLDLARTEYNP